MAPLSASLLGALLLPMLVSVSAVDLARIQSTRASQDSPAQRWTGSRSAQQSASCDECIAIVSIT